MLPLTLTGFLLRPWVLFPRWPFQRALRPHRQLCCCRSRVLAWLLETSPKGVFPPEKCPSCSCSLPWPEGWGSPWREGYLRVGEEERSFLHSFSSLFPTWTLHLELILCFYSFVYAQFFGMREVLGTDDSVSNSPKLSLCDTDYPFTRWYFRPNYLWPLVEMR